MSSTLYYTSREPMRYTGRITTSKNEKVCQDEKDEMTAMYKRILSDSLREKQTKTPDRIHAKSQPAFVTHSHDHE